MFIHSNTIKLLKYFAIKLNIGHIIWSNIVSSQFLVYPKTNNSLPIISEKAWLDIFKGKFKPHVLNGRPFCRTIRLYLPRWIHANVCSPCDTPGEHTISQTFMPNKLYYHNLISCRSLVPLIISCIITILSKCVSNHQPFTWWFDQTF